MQYASHEPMVSILGRCRSERTATHSHTAPRTELHSITLHHTQTASTIATLIYTSWFKKENHSAGWDAIGSRSPGFLHPSLANRSSSTSART
eukprot:966698-Rhodomonas_salina.3